MADIRDLFGFMITLFGGDTTLNGLGIGPNDMFALKAPEEQLPPYIIFERNAAQYHHPIGANPEVAVFHWIVVKCVCDGNSGGDVARQIMDRIRDLLTAVVNAPVASGTICRALPVSDLEYPEEDDGNIIFLHIGIQFKFILT